MCDCMCACFTRPKLEWDDAFDWLGSTFRAVFERLRAWSWSAYNVIRRKTAHNWRQCIIKVMNTFCECFFLSWAWVERHEGEWSIGTGTCLKNVERSCKNLYEQKYARIVLFGSYFVISRSWRWIYDPIEVLLNSFENDIFCSRSRFNLKKCTSRGGHLLVPGFVGYRRGICKRFQRLWRRMPWTNQVRFGARRNRPYETRIIQICVPA